MSCTVSAGLALAVPVKPDLLGERLEAYAKVVPVLRTLRLCHRVGKGPDVHVTKLPTEIELAIEALIIKHEQNQWYYWSDWRGAFSHYEGRCAPMSHLEDAYSPLRDAVEDVEECETCLEDHPMETAHCETLCKATDTDKCWTCSQKRDPDNCMRTCQAKIEHEMNTLAMDWEWDCDIDGDCKGWEKMINQSKDGNFAKYDKVLRQHFDLDVFLSTTRIANEDHDAWPRDINHHWHRKEELRTTICYLSLSTRPPLAQSKTYEPSDVENDCGGTLLEGTQAIAVNTAATKDKTKAKMRFRHAMNILGLKVYLHPSQRASIVMPSYGEQEEGEKKSNAHTTGWPKLVLLVKSSASTLD